MSTKTKTKTSQRLIAVKDITIDARVQRRPPSRRLVEDLASQMDLEAIGTLTMSERSDGSVVLLDGQRRVAALRSLEMTSHKCRCTVYHNLTLKQEAALFRRLNRTRAVSPFEDFDKGLVEGDRVCLKIEAVCKKYGWTVAQGSGSGKVSCVVALIKVVKRDDCAGRLLDRTVQVLTNAFGDQRLALNARLVEGVGRYLDEEHPKCSDQVVTELSEKLSAKFTPYQLLATCRQLRDVGGGTMAKHVADVVKKIHNGRLRRS